MADIPKTSVDELAEKVIDDSISVLKTTLEDELTTLTEQENQ